MESKLSLQAVSLTKSARQLAKYKLNLVEIQEVRWERGGTELADGYTRIYMGIHTYIYADIQWRAV
jgi:hypothetical protein